ncbi:MAG: helix-turn-helix domain-containing protein [Thiohalocapsa sp.]
MMPEPLAITLYAAAEALSVSPRTIRRLLDAGDLQRVRIGRAVRVSTASIRSYVDGFGAESDNPARAGPDEREKSTCRAAYARRRSNCSWHSAVPIFAR